MKNCPFCESNKLKIQHKRTSKFEYIDGKRYNVHTTYVTCNKCHARGPVTSFKMANNELDHHLIKQSELTAQELWNAAHKNKET